MVESRTHLRGDGLRASDDFGNKISPSCHLPPAGAASAPLLTTCGTAAPPTAAATISACSRSWTTFEPVAGLALASRPTYETGWPSSSWSLGATNVQAPMFCDSSWTQTHSRADRYRPSTDWSSSAGQG